MSAYSPQIGAVKAAKKNTASSLEDNMLYGADCLGTIQSRPTTAPLATVLTTILPTFYYSIASNFFCLSVNCSKR